MILACRQLHKAYGIDVILEKITFHIEEREKAAIVGVNGAGKTTLFKVLTSEISADGGEFYLKKDASLGYLAQNIQIDSDRTIYEEMLSVFEKIIQTETHARWGYHYRYQRACRIRGCCSYADYRSPSFP